MYQGSEEKIQPGPGNFSKAGSVSRLTAIICEPSMGEAKQKKKKETEQNRTCQLFGVTVWVHWSYNLKISCLSLNEFINYYLSSETEDIFVNQKILQVARQDKCM